MSEKRLGMLIDLALCIGCNACVVACKMENDVPLGCFNTWVESWDVEDGERTRRANVPKQCNHCENSPCVKVCPTGASYVADDGTVQILSLIHISTARTRPSWASRTATWYAPPRRSAT